MLNTKKRTKNNKTKEIAVSKSDIRLTLEQFNAYYNGKRKHLNVYLSENVEKKIFYIRYRIDKKKETVEIGYNRCGRDNGYMKANEKINDIQKQYEELGVVVINRTTNQDE